MKKLILIFITLVSLGCTRSEYKYEVLQEDDKYRLIRCWNQRTILVKQTEEYRGTFIDLEYNSNNRYSTASIRCLINNSDTVLFKSVNTIEAINIINITRNLTIGDSIKVTKIYYPSKLEVEYIFDR